MPAVSRTTIYIQSVHTSIHIRTYIHADATVHANQTSQLWSQYHALPVMICSAAAWAADHCGVCLAWHGAIDSSDAMALCLLSETVIGAHG